MMGDFLSQEIVYCGHLGEHYHIITCTILCQRQLPMLLVIANCETAAYALIKTYGAWDTSHIDDGIFVVYRKPI